MKMQMIIRVNWMNYYCPGIDNKWSVKTGIPGDLWTFSMLTAEMPTSTDYP